ncbi:MAG: PEGA domain-containing protein [Myxococcaceae bacterium]|nr:PEGA domain-containing protein [Myxococcaceae bacterium]
MVLVLLVQLALTAPPLEPSPEQVAASRDAFLWGQRLYKQGFAADALGKFEESWGLRALPVTAYNIAVCHEDLKREAQAIRWYREYLRRAPDAADKKDVLATITALELRLKKQGRQALVIITEPEGVDVEVGGQPYGVSPVVVTLPPGTHRVVARAKGLVSVERNVVLPDNTSAEVSLLLSPDKTESRVDPVKADVPARVELPVATEQPVTALTLMADDTLKKLVRRERTAEPWVLLGASAAVAVGGAVTLGLSIDADRRFQTSPPDTPGPTRDLLLTERNNFLAGAIALFSLAGVVAVTSLVIFIIESR